jgi:hypothetical protein
MERTDGVPLFVEEITKAVLEAETEGAPQRTAAVVPSPALAVPASLHGSLMARLDRVGPAKEIAQIGHEARNGHRFAHTIPPSAKQAAKPARISLEKYPRGLRHFHAAWLSPICRRSATDSPTYSIAFV